MDKCDVWHFECPTLWTEYEIQVPQEMHENVQNLYVCLHACVPMSELWINFLWKNGHNSTEFFLTEKADVTWWCLKEKQKHNANIY